MSQKAKKPKYWEAGTVVVLPSGRKYEVMENGEWRRVRGT